MKSDVATLTYDLSNSLHFPRSITCSEPRDIRENEETDAPMTPPVNIAICHSAQFENRTAPLRFLTLFVVRVVQRGIRWDRRRSRRKKRIAGISARVEEDSAHMKAAAPIQETFRINDGKRKNFEKKEGDESASELINGELIITRCFAQRLSITVPRREKTNSSGKNEVILATRERKLLLDRGRTTGRTICRGRTALDEEDGMNWMGATVLNGLFPARMGQQRIRRLVFFEHQFLQRHLCL